MMMSSINVSFVRNVRRCKGCKPLTSDLHAYIMPNDRTYPPPYTPPNIYIYK
jgi:hypothetical protein